MKRIIIIHHEPLTKKIKRNFFIDELRARGVVVEYWSVHKLLFNDLSLIDEIEDLNNIVFNSYSEIKDRIRISNTDSIFIIEFTITVKSYIILYYLTKYNCLISAFGIHSSINFSLKEKILNIRNYGYNKIVPFAKTFFNNLVICFLRKIIPIKQCDIFFYCGSASYSKSNAHIKIPINSFDFEDYRKLLESDNSPVDLKGKKYAVFLDEYLPYHPDIKIWGRQSLNPVKYYSSLNLFFSYLEEKYSLDVVIAAHPKSNYSDSLFRGRRIFKYRTAELVKYSSLVLAHDSLSISFPVLNYKPIKFLYLSEFYNMGTSIMALIKKNSKMLGAELVCIDNDNYTMKEVGFVDKERYDNYKYLYLTSSESENECNANIIYSYLKSVK